LELKNREEGNDESIRCAEERENQLLTENNGLKK